MAVKGRNAINQMVGQKIYDNNNKEILASMVREVMADYRDSYFNLIDDKLKDMKYQGNVTLEQHLANVAGGTPIWGSTGFFDPGGNSVQSIPAFNGGSGIVASAEMVKLTFHDAQIIINLNANYDNRKFMVSIWTDGNLNINNDVCAPVLRRVNANEIHVGLREVTDEAQSIRLEILGFLI